MGFVEALSATLYPVGKPTSVITVYTILRYPKTGRQNPELPIGVMEQQRFRDHHQPWNMLEMACVGRQQDQPGRQTGGCDQQIKIADHRKWRIIQTVSSR
jgi:hypothetical protein